MNKPGILSPGAMACAILLLAATLTAICNKIPPSSQTLQRASLFPQCTGNA
jgi:hypothetical protein